MKSIFTKNKIHFPLFFLTECLCPNDSVLMGVASCSLTVPAPIQREASLEGLMRKKMMRVAYSDPYQLSSVLNTGEFFLFSSFFSFWGPTRLSTAFHHRHHIAPVVWRNKPPPLQPEPDRSCFVARWGCNTAVRRCFSSRQRSWGKPLKPPGCWVTITSNFIHFSQVFVFVPEQSFLSRL